MNCAKSIEAIYPELEDKIVVTIMVPAPKNFMIWVTKRTFSISNMPWAWPPQLG